MKSSPQVAVSANGLNEALSAALLKKTGLGMPISEQAAPGCDALDVSLVVPANRA